MQTIWPYILLAFAAGFCLPTQAGINTQLNLWSRSAILTATISFAVGTIVLAVYTVILRVPWPSERPRHPLPVVDMDWWIPRCISGCFHRRSGAATGRGINDVTDHRRTDVCLTFS